MMDKRLWQQVKFGDVVRLNTKRCADPEAEGIERYVGIEHIQPEDLRIRSWGLVEEGTTFTNYFKPGQVLFVKRRAYQRKVAVAEFEGVCSGDIYVLEPKDDHLLPELLPFICQTDAFYAHAVNTSAGSLSPRTNWKQLAEYEFALPPLAEQQRIADLLWSVQRLLESYHKASEQTRKLIVSRVEYFLSSYAAKIYTQPAGRLLRESPRNGFSPQTNDSNQGLRTVSISAVQDGYFAPEGKIKYANVKREKVAQFLVEKGDIFAVRGNGNLYLTGKCGISRKSYSDLFYPDLLIRLRFDESKILPYFAVLQWNSPAVHRNLISRAKTTSGIWKINGQDIRKHTLIVPPRAEQSRLLEEIAQIESTSEKLRKRLVGVAEIKASILNEYLQDGP